MKKFMSIALSLMLVSTQFVPVMADITLATAPQPMRMAGNVTKVEGDSILVEAYDGKSSVALNITAETNIVDAVSGGPTMTPELQEDVIVYYGPETTKSLPPQSEALVVISDMPADYQAPQYSVVETVEKTNDGVKILVDGSSLIVAITNKTPIMGEDGKTAMTVSDISVGDGLLLWNGVATLSFPANTAAEKVVILDSTTETVVPEAPVDVPTMEVVDKTLPKSDIAVKGALPEFKSTADADFAKKVNMMVDDIYKKAMEEAKTNKAKEVMFSYDVFNYESMTSVVIHTSISTGNTGSDDVNTIVVDSYSSTVCTLEDALGVNATKIVNKAISDEMKKAAEGTYYTDENAFDGIVPGQEFYIDEKGNVIVIFDKYSIAPGTAGTPMFTIPMSSSTEVVIPIESTFVNGSNGMRMVALRPVAEGFLYEVSWDAATRSAMLAKDDMTYTVVIDSNNYDGKELESAPILINDVTYVPISFFEVVMGMEYTIDETSVTFS